MTLGERVKLLISDQRMNQKQFANHVGIDEKSLSRLCNGIGSTTMKNMDKIIQAYPKLNLDWLFRGQGEMWGKRSPVKEGNRPLLIIDPNDKNSIKELKKLLREDED